MSCLLERIEKRGEMSYILYVHYHADEDQIEPGTHSSSSDYLPGTWVDLVDEIIKDLKCQSKRTAFDLTPVCQGSQKGYDDLKMV